MCEYTNYSVGSDDGKSISFKKEEAVFNGTSFTIKFWHIGIALIIFISLILTFSYLNFKKTIDIPQSETLFSKDGFVFEESSTSFITREEILALQNVENITFQRLLEMAINEIYARRGQVFLSGEINDEYYLQFEWYIDTYKHIVEWDEFNEKEKANLRLLISIEEEYGYR